MSQSASGFDFDFYANVSDFDKRPAFLKSVDPFRIGGIVRSDVVLKRFKAIQFDSLDQYFKYMTGITDTFPLTFEHRICGDDTIMTVATNPTLYRRIDALRYYCLRQSDFPDRSSDYDVSLGLDSPDSGTIMFESDALVTRTMNYVPMIPGLGYVANVTIFVGVLQIQTVRPSEDDSYLVIAYLHSAENGCYPYEDKAHTLVIRVRDSGVRGVLLTYHDYHVDISVIEYVSSKHDFDPVNSFNLYPFDTEHRVAIRTSKRHRMTLPPIDLAAMSLGRTPFLTSRGIVTSFHLTFSSISNSAKKIFDTKKRLLHWVLSKKLEGGAANDIIFEYYERREVTPFHFKAGTKFWMAGLFDGLDGNEFNFELFPTHNICLNSYYEQ